MIKAYAKVNLKLKILGKLENGYHELDMINTKISLHDSIYIKPSKRNKISYSNYKISNDEDTIYKMIVLLQQKYALPNFNIYIKKRIPVGFGLGGMSCDAASILNYVNDSYKLNMSLNEKIQFIRNFGTDMIYCLQNKPARVAGIGDIVETIDPINYAKIIIINPNIYISTKEMYNEIKNYDLSKSNLNNDFEYIARKKYKNIDCLIKKIQTLTNGIVQMSGSGSAIFVLGYTKHEYKNIKKHLDGIECKEFKIMKG